MGLFCEGDKPDEFVIEPRVASINALDPNRAELAFLRRIPLQYRHSARKYFYRFYYGYENIADPYKILWIDPKKIEYVTSADSKVDTTMGSDISDSITYDMDRGRFSKVRIGSIKHGDWDKEMIRFDDLYLPQAVEEHYQNGVPWEETEFFQRYKRYLEFGNKAYGVNNYQEFVNFFPEYIHNIYENMLYEGYNTNKLSPDVSLEKKGAKEYEGSGQESDKIFQHIAINIGRNGKFLFNNSEGHHRLSIARILDIDVVPVSVIVRHHEWQKTRDQYAHSNRDHHASTHEDLVSEE